MPPAVIAAGIGAAAGIGGAVIGSKAQKKAATQASDTALQTANMNNALAREFRDANQANFQPNLQSGYRSNALLDAFLFGPQQQNQQFGQPSPVSNGTPMQGQSMSPSGSQAWFTALQGRDPGALNAMSDMDRFSPLFDMQTGSPLGNGSIAPTGAPMGQVQATGQGGNPLDAYEAFRNSPFYQFPLDEGFRSLNHRLASGGMLTSGAAGREAIRFGQNYGSQRMGEFLGLAENQANRGIQGASAIAGVGQNALSSMTANNNAAGSAAANAALMRGQSTANMWSGIGGSIGNLAGNVFGQSSYKGF